ncbi:MAG: hypothetical protein UH239_03750 [Acutalibacteraceae bacterium]|nr:hypothetical protein [Acutalibacteraceae bacterium]
MKRYIITIMMLIAMIVILSSCTNNNTDSTSDKNKNATEIATSIVTQKPTDAETLTQAIVNEDITEVSTQIPTEKITDAKEEISTDSSSEANKENSTQATTSTPINIRTYTNGVSPGGDAFVEIQGKPDTEYNIAVYYNSEAIEANGLENKVSDANGYIRWEWTIGSKTTPGTYKIVINGDGQKKEIEFTVME